MLNDDDFGVAEPLNETAYGQGLVSRGQHYVIGGNSNNPDDALLKEKELATSLALRPWFFVTPIENLSYAEWSQSFSMKVLQ